MALELSVPQTPPPFQNERVQPDSTAARMAARVCGSPAMAPRRSTRP